MPVARSLGGIAEVGEFGAQPFRMMLAGPFEDRERALPVVARRARLAHGTVYVAEVLVDLHLSGAETMPLLSSNARR
ncbi:hypothetical protein GCM10029992_13440 [Glycomyces albus]